MPQVTHINAAQLFELKQQNPDSQLVDIRDAESYAAGHTLDAQRLHNENIAQFIAEADLDAPLVVICYHGISSVSAGQYLIEQGFEEVYSLEGGYQAWAQLLSS
ncbi:thiosulfate sulfurtransferase GlpE [Parashewanella spongiae]|uniref:Thiosulfate sulfurtransferase GlpE n=1 Tax=Parashewanella spongiae TaxID=342950 RepID=A0A3A6TNX5_9GAMM|nr:thiosulfate sulfurtransferase GlpE [Parashewanella spongiae]MCL1077858.1 thiosulfate sulfurtransferase GlpE [Parashewanella spongiae]RJY17622.1 thiosulfate sulfurtransferase GlpE [Parashewanella spongiae]